MAICMYCKRREDEQSGTWLETTPEEIANEIVSHSLCPDCLMARTSLRDERKKELLDRLNASIKT